MESFEGGRHQLQRCRHLANDRGAMHESVLANNVRECLWASYNWVLVAALASCAHFLLVPRLRRAYGRTLPRRCYYTPTISAIA